MSTRATIKFQDRDEVYFVYRGHDGFPEIVLDDIRSTIERARGRWSYGEAGQLLSLFFVMHGDVKTRLQHYEPTTGWHGDESYRYEVVYSEKDREWKAGTIQHPEKSGGEAK